MNYSLFRDLLKLDHGGLLYPPGCSTTFIRHPSGANESVEVGIVHEHRFAFYYWLGLKKKLSHRRQEPRLRDADYVPPDLLTIDWHDDVGGECDFIPSFLHRLNQRDPNEVGLFCWLGLRPLNDGHVAPAVYLNAIGDVYVILKQGEGAQKLHPHQRHRVLCDRYGREHQVRYFFSPEEYLDQHGVNQSTPLALDIDLDYFVTCRAQDERLGAATPVPTEAVESLLDPNGELMEWALSRLCCLTIALEPQHCGGIANSLHILGVLDRTLFSPSLHHADGDWRHLHNVG